MTIAISEVLLLDASRNEFGLSQTNEICTLNGSGRVETVLPASFSWVLAIECAATNSDTSTLMCSAAVFDSSDALVADGYVTWDPNRRDRTELSLGVFRVTVTGTYTVRLYSGESCVWSASVLVTDSAA